MTGILAIILLLVIILGIINEKYNNPYKLYMIFGKKGSGKSSYLAKLALYYRRKKYIIYTNMVDLNVKNVRYIDPNNIGEFVPVENSVLLLDEVGMLYDNRDFKKFKSDTRDFYKLQRHYKVIVYLASQTFDVDKKLRDLTDKLFLVSNLLPYLSIIRPITKRIALTEAQNDGESRIVDNLKFEWIFNWKFIYLPRYSKYFESFKVDKKPYIPFTEKEGDIVDRRTISRFLEPFAAFVQRKRRRKKRNETKFGTSENNGSEKHPEV